MSRGLGRTQRKVLEELRRYYDAADAVLRDRWRPNVSWDSTYQYPGQSTFELAQLVYGVEVPSQAQLRSVRRAIASLFERDRHVWIGYGSVATQPRGRRQSAAVPGQHVRWMPLERPGHGVWGTYRKTEIAQGL